MARSQTLPEKKSPTQEIIKQCKKDLCEEKVAAASAAEASNTDCKALRCEEQYKICCVSKAEETHTFYRNFKYCVGIDISKKSELINGKIKYMIDKDIQLQKLFKDLMKKVKVTKGLMNEAVEIACRLERCIEEEQRCNLGIYQALENGIPTIWERIENCKTETENCYDKIKVAFDRGVDIAGILTFTNIGSLKDQAAALYELILSLLKDCQDNLVFSSTEEQKAHEELIKILEELGIAGFEKCMKSATAKSLADLYDFICNPGCEEKEPERIREICRKFTGELPPDGTEACEEEETNPVPGPRKGKDWSMG